MLTNFSPKGHKISPIFPILKSRDSETHQLSSHAFHPSLEVPVALAEVVDPPLVGVGDVGVVAAEVVQTGGQAGVGGVG